MLSVMGLLAWGHGETLNKECASPYESRTNQTTYPPTQVKLDSLFTSMDALSGRQAALTKVVLRVYEP